MTNNKKEINRTLFERLERELPTENATVKSFNLGSDTIRYIQTKKESFAQEILTKASINEVLETSNKTMIFTLSMEDRIFLIITGAFETSSFSLKGVYPVLDPDNTEQDFKHNPGLITLLFSQEKFPISNRDIRYELMEKVFSREGKAEGAFEANELTQFFSDFSIWELDIDLNITPNTLLALYAGFLIEQKKNFNLNFYSDTLLNLKLLIEELPIDLIGGNLLRAIVSMEWKHSFLELYQCIEYLYPIPYLICLSNNLGDPIHFKKLFQNTEIDLNWRPREDQALEKLIKEIEEKDSVSQMVTCIKSVFKITDTIQKDNEIPLISKHIYQTRNSIAHFRSALKINIKNDSDWNDIIETLIGIIYDLYSKYSSQISLVK